MTDAKVMKLPKQAAEPKQPSSRELAELAAVISQGGVELNPEQVKISWLYAEKRGLDIISRQLIPTVIRGKLTFITTIDGFRVIAERSGDYAGQDPIKYQTNEKSGKLLWAEATVYRHSWGDRGLTVRAYWDEFVPDGKGDYMWKKMPHVMLGKVAEAQALRKAFPNDMSGMYSDDEMAQSGVKPGAVHEATPPTPKELAEQQDADAEGPTAEEEQLRDEVANVRATQEANAQVEEEEEVKARPRYPRRRAGTSDAEWAARLTGAKAISPSQNEWLKDWLAKEEWDGTERRVHQTDDHPGRRSTDKPKAVEGEVITDPEDGADFDALNAGQYSGEVETEPEQQGDLVDEAAKTFADELPVLQGTEGELIETDAIVMSTEGMVTPKGNEVFVCWVTDREHRIETVQAQQLADASGASSLGKGQPVKLTGTWKNVGGRMVVIAGQLRAEAA